MAEEVADMPEGTSDGSARVWDVLICCSYFLGCASGKAVNLFIFEDALAAKLTR